ncbi:archease [Candidatus Woesearchaeota archaeon]|nr:archease [Candidatus Woesearchaeota archaeon]|tara:strand:- start:345 stop:770 length:426 start_codon:yes stop_codon:yes gene_type:complete
MPYKYIEGLTTADVAFEAKGKTLNELFESAALALFDIMAEPKKVSKKIKKTFSIEKDNLEELMYNFLDEILFFKDSESMVFNSCKVNVKKIEKLKLEATLFGDKVNHKKQELKVDPKAVTMHKFEVKKEKDSYKARVIIDI